jgi:hypothetical protein
MLEKAGILPSFFYTSFISELNLVFVFIIVALIIGMIIEGIYQTFAECYFALDFNKNIFKNKNGKKVYATIRGRLLYYIIGVSTIYEASRYYEEKTDENPMKTFIKDSNITTNFYAIKVYNALYICSKIIEKDDNTTNIYKFRDRSFILQLVRMSFFCILVTTIIPGIYFIFKAYNKGCKSFEIFGLFIIISLIISIASIIIIAPCAYSFGKRFIRDVGQAYEALKFKLPFQLKKHIKYQYSKKNN